MNLLAELAEELRAAGDDVEVLTGFPNYPSGGLYPGYPLRLFRRDTIDGIRVHRVMLYPDHGDSALRRILNYGSFAFMASLLGPFLVRRPDVIYVYGSPVTAGWAGWSVSRLRRAPFVFAVPDLWPEVLEAAGVRSRFILSAAARFARAIYRRAASVIAVTEGFRRSVIARGVPEEKVTHIPVWVDLRTYESRNPSESMRQRLGIARPVVIMYAGYFGPSQGLEVFVEAATLLKDNDSIEIVLVGAGPAREALEAMIRERELVNIRVAGPFPPAEMSDVYSVASALAVHLADSPLFRLWIPHKLYAYLAVGKPVLCALQGEAERVVRDAGAGLVGEPKNPADLARMIATFAALPEEERQRMGESARRTAESHYGSTVVIARIREELRRAAESG